MMKIGYPLSISMTPSFYDKENMLLRAQLKCLSTQTVKDFDVFLIDCHYDKRRDVIPELANKFNLDIKHIPYIPAKHHAKFYDCAIFNASYIYSPSTRNARYSCYRFVKNDYVKKILDAPEGVNVDFYYRTTEEVSIINALKEEKAKNIEKLHSYYIELCNSVWQFESEDIDWSKLPQKSVIPLIEEYKKRGETVKNIPFPDCLGGWITDYDEDSEVMTAHHGMYGNFVWHRDQWIYELNGTNEVVTNGSHWEDMDFGNRARALGHQIVRRTDSLMRLKHHYGSFSQRSNVEVDEKYQYNKNVCPRCCELYHGNLSFKGFLEERILKNEIEVFYDKFVWVCKTCLLSGPYFPGEELQSYFDAIADNKLYKAPIVKKYKIGRNLKSLTEKIDSVKSLQEKVEIYHDSWENDYYYD
tara:strand:+ start:145 stop:1386 length:1242 start_codon:yes stop_codon:yes gene_type:complete